MKLDSLTIAVTNEYDLEYRAERPRRRVRLGLDEIRYAVDQAAAAGCKLIIFSGGEPFLLGKTLEEAVAHAAGRVPGVRVVTNCYWATTPHEAVSAMKVMREAGLNEIDIRLSDWNQEPKIQQAVKWAARAAEKAGITIVSQQVLDRSQKRGFHILHLKEYPSSIGDSYRPKAAGLNSDLHPLALLPYNRQADYRSGDSSPFQQLSERNHCPYIFNSVTAHPDGKLTACGGQACSIASGLNLGDWFTTPIQDLVNEGQRNALLQAIRMKGPRGLREFIEEREPNIGFEESYANACHLCGDLLTRFETRQFLSKNASRAAEEAIAQRIEQLEAIKGELRGGEAGFRETA